MKFYLKGSVSELHVHNPKGPSTALETRVTEEDLMSKPCKSGSANELDVTPHGDQSLFICVCARVCVFVNPVKLAKYQDYTPINLSPENQMDTRTQVFS